jgi:sporulation protein YlmC with PRC-barrel domain
MQSPTTFPCPMLDELIMQTQSRVQPQQWVVKTRQGSVVGHVKSLTICHCSKQIVSALLVLRNSGQQVQIPWNRFEMVEEQLVLRVPVGRHPRASIVSGNIWPGKSLIWNPVKR